MSIIFTTRMESKGKNDGTNCRLCNEKSEMENITANAQIPEHSLIDQ